MDSIYWGYEILTRKKMAFKLLSSLRLFCQEIKEIFVHIYVLMGMVKVSTIKINCRGRV